MNGAVTTNPQEVALPKGFEALQPFATDWARLKTSQERLDCRHRTETAELHRLYSAGAPMLPTIFEHLDQFPVSQELPEPERNLYGMALAIFEAGQIVEIYDGRPFATTIDSISQVGPFKTEFGK